MGNRMGLPSILGRLLLESSIEGIDPLKEAEILVRRPIKTISINILGGYRGDQIFKILGETGIEISPLDGLERRVGAVLDGYELLDNAIHRNGGYYIMEMASAALHTVLETIGSEEKMDHVLDVAAAPGGKTFIAANTYPDSTIVANEPNRARHRRLVNNIVRHCLYNVWASRHRGEKLPTSGPYDLVIFDAPCTGLDLLYKRPQEVVANLKYREAYSSLQRSIVRHISQMVRRGGYLIYSTCTLTREETIDVYSETLKYGWEPIHKNLRLPLETFSPDDAPGSFFILPSLNIDRYRGNTGLMYISIFRKIDGPDIDDGYTKPPGAYRPVYDLAREACRHASCIYSGICSDKQIPTLKISSAEEIAELIRRGVVRHEATSEIRGKALIVYEEDGEETPIALAEYFSGMIRI